jgi:hypothetical protein
MLAWIRPTPALMGLAFLISYATMLWHNLRELPLSPVDVENSGPLLVAVVLYAAYLRRPRSQVVLASILGWALLNLFIGGIGTVLPLPIWPSAPEQSVSHYLAHAVYTAGQLPLAAVALAALRLAAQPERGQR